MNSSNNNGRASSNSGGDKFFVPIQVAESEATFTFEEAPVYRRVPSLAAVSLSGAAADAAVHLQPCFAASQLSVGMLPLRRGGSAWHGGAGHITEKQPVVKASQAALAAPPAFSWLERTHFSVSRTPYEAYVFLNEVLTANCVAVEECRESFSLCCSAVVNSAVLKFVVRVYCSRANTRGFPAGTTLVEFQRRRGCCAAHHVIYEQVRKCMVGGQSPSTCRGVLRAAEQAMAPLPVPQELRATCMAREQELAAEKATLLDAVGDMLRSGMVDVQTEALSMLADLAATDAAAVLRHEGLSLALAQLISDLASDSAAADTGCRGDMRVSALAALAALCAAYEGLGSAARAWVDARLDTVLEHIGGEIDSGALAMVLLNHLITVGGASVRAAVFRHVDVVRGLERCSWAQPCSSGDSASNNCRRYAAQALNSLGAVADAAPLGC